ncbi:MAG TPA: hypothetical protein VHZ31_01225 [Solirubrobacteraceae bacterium]|nr:hypothetical protein [Solirubrobacteraceae bacterium]
MLGVVTRVGIRMLAAARSERGLGRTPGRAALAVQGTAHTAHLGLDMTTLAGRPARRQIGLVGATACFVRALVVVTQMLDIGPPSAGLRMCHVVWSSFDEAYGVS